MEICADWDADDFASYLKERGLHKDVVTNIIDNRITSALFLSLNEDDLKELAPTIGDRIALRKILEQARKVSNPERKYNVNIELLPIQCQEQTDLVFPVTDDPPPSNEINIATSSQPLREPNCNPAVTQSSSVTSSSDWHFQFTIPELHSFSQPVKDAVKTGLITAQARREINQVLRTYMTAHTIKPTSEQYNIVCRKLIVKFPKLQDTEGTSNYVSTYIIVY